MTAITFGNMTETSLLSISQALKKRLLISRLVLTRSIGVVNRESPILFLLNKILDSPIALPHHESIHWVVWSTPLTLSPDALSPDTLSPRALSPRALSPLALSRHTLITDGLSESVFIVSFCSDWVVCSTPHALSPDALSPDTLSPRALSPHTLSTDRLSESVL